MKNNRIKGFSIAGALLVVILAVLGYWIYYCLNPSKERVMAAGATIKAYSHYELRQDGKLVLRFDEDTVSLAANFMNRWALLPSCGGRLAAAYNNSISNNRYQKVDADTLLKEKVDFLDSVYTDSKWKVGELNYYLHSHSVQDLGYNPISAYAQREIILRDSARKMLDSLKHIRKKGRVKLVRCISYKAFFRQADGKWTSESCELLTAMDGRNTAGLHLFRLTSETTPDGVAALSPRLASSLALTRGTTLCRSINYKLKPDSLGYYEGAFDSLYQANGYGRWQAYDGTYYEGEWQAGCRHGWGFSIAPRKPLRVGEWKNDRYKGERLVYTSERIYGIDISKYQHGKGRKKYPINWDRLRITHLGRLSRKTVSGAVNFPIRYIYIKSTEGTSLLNSYYRKDYLAAKAHGFKVGSYHFFSTISPAAQQAHYFLKHSYIRKGDFPPVLDVEPLPSQIRKMGGAGVLFSRVRTWLRIVEKATGTKPILYISQIFVNRYLSMAPDIKQNYLVWIARYGEYKPDIHLVYWQLCPDGRVAGIRGEVDINVFNGYKDAFMKFSQNEAVK